MCRQKVKFYFVVALDNLILLLKKITRNLHSRLMTSKKNFKTCTLGFQTMSKLNQFMRNPNFTYQQSSMSIMSQEVPELSL